MLPDDTIEVEEVPGLAKNLQLRNSGAADGETDGQTSKMIW